MIVRHGEIYLDEPEYVRERYRAATQTWHFMGSDDSFVPGRGYWVHSKVEAEWEVPL